MTAPPRHPQLMDPADDPEEFIASSIYWYPLLFPTRTEVLDHTFLCNGNGYEWSEDGEIASVFARIDPGLDRLDRYEAEARKYEAEARAASNEALRDLSLEQAARERAEHARLLAIRADHLHLARTYGPARVTEQVPQSRDRQARMITSSDLPWTLLGRAPEHVAPRWRAVLDEVRELFEAVLVEQGALW
jgi:hypothetical protein